jgi:hypothetical protein
MDITLAFWLIGAFFICLYLTQHITLMEKKDKDSDKD